MSGDELVELISKLPPEKRKLPVVVQGQDGWYYDAASVEAANIHEGREQDDGEPNAVCITSLS